MAIFSFGTSAILTTFVLEQFPTRLRATGAACASASISLGFALFPVIVTYFVARIGWQSAITACVAPLLFLSGLSVLAMTPPQPGAEMADL
jgi:MFS family permease